MIAIAFTLIILMLKSPGLRIFLFNARFVIPEMPVFQTISFERQSFVMPECIVLKLASHDAILLKTLQQQGWPAYVSQSEILIGPYLKSFQSRLDLSKIGQITPIAVKISNVQYPSS
jgi:hypothetical protein